MDTVRITPENIRPYLSPPSLNGSITEETSPSNLNVDINFTVGCTGGTSGSAQAMITGGALPYQFLWSTGDTTASVEDLSTGTYAVTVTDQNGCTATNSAFLNQPIPLNSNPLPVSTSCADVADGAIDLDVWGGSPAYTYQWSNGDTTQNLTGLAEGTYTVTVTDMAGCTSISQTNVDTPFPININVQGLSNVTCFGESDGAILANAFGGNPGYNYLWSNGDTTTFVDSLAAGLYTVTITDAVGCTGTGEVNVLAPAELETFIFGSSVCNGSDDGTANVTVSGGTIPFAYAWSNGETTAQIQNLTPGTYTVTVTDFNQCSVVDTITINLNSTILEANPLFTPVSCPNGNDGSASVMPTGGVAPYTYSWSTGQTDSLISNLSAGTYTVVINDLFNCSLTEVIELPAPTAFEVNATVTPTSCGANNGMIVIDPTGGMPPYTFEWFNGSTNDTITNLATGAYPVNITDANNCIQQFFVEVTAGVNEAPVAFTQNLTVSLDSSGMATVDPALIDNGSSDDCGIDSMYVNFPQLDCSQVGVNVVTLTVVDEQGETGSATAIVFVEDNTFPEVEVQDVTIYLDSIGLAALSTDQVVISSSDNCGIDTTTLSTTQYNCFNVGENTVTLTTADNSGNISLDTITITLVDTIGPTLVCPNDILLESCDSMVIADYTIPLVMDNCPVGPANLVVGILPGAQLTEGVTTTTYDYTDGSGNTGSCSFDIDFSILPQVEVQLDSIVEATNNNANGAFFITVTSGVAPYVFEWSLVNGSEISNDEDPSGLPSGNYEVVVTDANGCVASLLIELTTSVRNFDLGKKVSIFPNPTTAQLFVQLDFQVAVGDYFELYALDGKVLLRDQLSSNDELVELDLSKLQTGMYLLKITSQEGVVAKKVFVKR
ncbi:MAG: T9SS type A sorting domain-containing protein [Bacteroidota bacterium]